MTTANKRTTTVNYANHSKFVKGMFVFIALSGTFSVLFGAWLAHGGQALPDEVKFRLSNALQYQFIHTLALLAVLAVNLVKSNKWLLVSASCFCGGILLFSGSLYLKTLFAVDIIGKAAPFGGITLALGWLVLSIAGVSLVKNKQ